MFNLRVHWVFVTKYRHKVFTAAALAALKRTFAQTCTDFEAELQSFEGECDHVHLLIAFPPQVALARLGNSLKGVSSRQLRRERPETAKHYYKGVLWSPSYFAAPCGGAPLALIKQCIENQDRPR